MRRNPLENELKRKRGQESSKTENKEVRARRDMQEGGERREGVSEDDKGTRKGREEGNSRVESI